MPKEKMGEHKCSPFIYVALSFSFLALAYSADDSHLTCVQSPKTGKVILKLIWPDWSFSRATDLLPLYYSSAYHAQNLEFLTSVARFRYTADALLKNSLNQSIQKSKI
jgi:hypothetical protein